VSTIGIEPRSATTVHTPAELRDLLVTVIAGAAGGDEQQWRDAVGPVEKLPIATNARSNWRVKPTGDQAKRGVIARAFEIVRAAHPYVAG
jgi:hypothetical protein